MRVEVVLPSGPIRDGPEREAYEAGLELLRGLVAPVSAPEPRTPEVPWLAGTDEERADELLAALARRPDALWMGRGGYGATRLLAAAGERIARAAPAPLFAFSDGTALIGHWAELGWPCWLAPPLVQLPRLGASSRQRLERALAGEVPPFEGLGPIVSGRARGPLAGGNLAVLASLVGTPFMPRLGGAILVLEDVGEAAYRIDRMLHQLLFAGALEGVRGVALGSFSGVGEGERAEVERCLAGFFARLAVPCASALPVGHGEDNAALPMGPGWVAELEVGAAGRLVVGRA